MLAPYSVAKGMLALGDGTENEIQQKKNASKIMNLILDNIPTVKFQERNKSGKVVTMEQPAYKASFSDNMIKEAEAYYNQLSVTRAHKKRMSSLDSFFKNYTPTISLGEALYRLSLQVVFLFD